MEYDPDNPATQSRLTKICRVIANPNSRRVLEMLAFAPMTIGNLHERIDLRVERIRDAAEMLVSLNLVQRVGGRKRQAVTYRLAKGGLDLVRSWLDRVASMSDAEE
ncbi:MAG TPA: hypothetical protein VG271_20370 [Beijerinckiaceae bacterium]|jgi:hypothetical protein|nr:hypothetical protein [Beijerinckiaceae bacterium]